MDAAAHLEGAGVAEADGLALAGALEADVEDAARRGRVGIVAEGIVVHEGDRLADLAAILGWGELDVLLHDLARQRVGRRAAGIVLVILALAGGQDGGGRAERDGEADRRPKSRPFPAPIHRPTLPAPRDSRRPRRTLDDGGDDIGLGPQRPFAAA